MQSKRIIIRSTRVLDMIYPQLHLSHVCPKNPYIISENILSLRWYRNSQHLSSINNLNFYNPVRNFHSSLIFSTHKEPSKVEETVQILKEIKKKEGLIKNSEVCLSPKRSLGKKIWDEVVHYYHGFRLLFIDVKVSSRLAWKILNGSDLTRREHRQLVRTVSDMFRLVPFSIFIIVPFMELLLPVFLMLFPSMLPSTFTTKSAAELKFKKKLKMKIEMAKFLQDTLEEMAVTSKGDTHSDTAKDFIKFLQKIRNTGQQASNEDILKFSKLFEDDITLENLPRPQLMALVRLLELQPIGSNNFLRFQLRNKIRCLRADDVMIQNEGIENLTISEVQSACRARGMRALGIPEHRLRSSLQQWLELSLNEKIPPSLLLLSRALYLPENLPSTEQLKITLSALSEAAAIEAKYKIGEMEGKVDNKTKLELIKKEEERIRKEAEEFKQQELDKEKKEKEELEKKLQEVVASEEMLTDKAPVLKDQAKIIEEKRVELSKEDFEELENALENIASEKNKLLIEKEEIEDLKEEMADYKQDVEELKEVVLETGHKEIKESKAALRLSNKVEKMVSKMDSLVDNLTNERQKLQHASNDKTKEGVNPVKEREDIVGINELVLTIQRIQKVSDDTRLQMIVDVLEKMDIDRDGSVEVEHVLKVIKLLGDENVKVTKEQMDDIVELLMKEGSLELEQKIMKKMQHDNSTAQTEKSNQSVK